MSKSLKMIIEALLFSSDKPLTVKDIHDCLPDAEKSEIKNSIKILTHDYDTLERSFVLKEVAGGYQFRSRPEYGSYILRMFQKTPNRLSRATIETLAIIAYKQPIMRSEIERLRGVDVGGIVRTLMEKGLVKIMGRKELPGRPLIYGTTKKFLEVFDLKDLKSLPKLKEIKDFAADQYEPTIINPDVANEEVSSGEAVTEEITPPSGDQPEETPENETDSNEVQGETTETEVEEIAEIQEEAGETEAEESPESTETEVDTSSEDMPESEADSGAEDTGMSEPENGSDTEDKEIPEPEIESDSNQDDTSIAVPQEDMPEEDDSIKKQDTSAPENSIEPEENGTES